MHKWADFIFEIPAGFRPFWPLSMHEPLVCGLTLRLLFIPPFALGTTQAFWTWLGPCKACGHMCWGMNGVFCTNFATPQLHWTPCHSVWHGRCYMPHPDDHFYYHVVTDDDGFDWRLP